MKAILLAAGMGTRLRPLTYTTPKSLVMVNGKPLLERQIEFLREVGVEDIYVVTGYLAEKFHYLESQGIHLIHNEMYDKYNNVYTMYLVRNLLGDSYVLDADVYLHRNFLLKSPQTSTYFSGCKDNVKQEWKLHYDQSGKIFNITIEDGKHHILSGVSFWTKSDAEIIVEKLENVIADDNFTDLYWDNIVKSNLDKLNVHIAKIANDDWFEIDSLEELRDVEEFLKRESGKG